LLRLHRHKQNSGGGLAQLAERRAGRWKVTKLEFDSWCDSESLCPWGMTLNAIFQLGAKQSTYCGGPAWRKICKQNIFYVGVVWKTQNIHLVQTKKN